MELNLKIPDGLTMGATTSAIFAENFLQWSENIYFVNILKHDITGYFRYVDDILIVAV
jgi:hypothetical protein